MNVVTRTKTLAAVVAVVLTSSIVEVCSARGRPSDSMITLQVKEKLRSDLRLRKADLAVRTIAGTVRLEGDVTSYLDKYRAERLCKEIDGVRQVLMRVKVQSQSTSDREIAESLNRRFSQDPILRRRNVNADVRSRLVRIAGVANNPAEKRHAERLAREARGVLGIRNELQLKPENSASLRSDEFLEEEVIAAIRRDVRLGEFPIDIDVQRGVVRLRGVVVNFFLKELARERARSVSGVLQVDNQLDVIRLAGRNEADRLNE